MSQAIILRNDAARTCEASEEFQWQCAAAIESSSLIGRVSNEVENERLNAALMTLQQLIKLVTDGHAECKRPVLDFCRAIDSMKRSLEEPLIAEKMRLGKLGGDYQQILLANKRAAEAAALKELQEIERRKQEELAKAQTIEEHQAIRERAQQEAQMALPAPAVTAPKGQTVVTDIEFEVFDVAALATYAPACVRIEPRKSEIRALLKTLKAGERLPGVRHWETTKVGVRLPQTRMVDA